MLVCEGAAEARQVMVQLARHWGAKVLATATAPMAAQQLQEDPAVSQLIDLSVRGTSLSSAVLEATGGLGVDCVVDLGVLDGTAGPTKHEVLTCLAAGGKWVTMAVALQLDPPESKLLHYKGASVCFLNEHVWNLSGGQQGRYLTMLEDLLRQMAKGVVKPHVNKVVPLEDLVGDAKRKLCLVGKVVVEPTAY